MTVDKDRLAFILKILQKRSDFATANALKLQTIVAQYDQTANRNWFVTFRFIVKAMTDLFAIIFFRVSTLNVDDGPFVAADVLGIVCSFVLSIADEKQAQTNLQVVQTFLTDTLLECDDEKVHGKLADILGRFLHMCGDSRYRCSPEHVCKARVRQLNMESMKPLAQAPLRPKWIGYQILKSPSSTLAPREFRKLPRHVQLREQVRKRWELACGRLPHVLCLIAKQGCRCHHSGDKQLAAELLKLKWDLNLDFAEVDSCVRRGMQPPKALLDRIAVHEATLSHVSNHATAIEQKAELRDDEGWESSIRAKNVTSSGVSNLQTAREYADWVVRQDFLDNVASLVTPASAEVAKKADLGPSSLSTASSTRDDQESPPPSELPAMSERELEIKDKLCTCLEGIIKLDRAGTALAGAASASHAGVSRQLQAIAVGHIDTAWTIAHARDYLGLQAWLESKYNKPNAAKTNSSDEARGATGEQEEAKTSKKASQPVSLEKGVESAAAGPHSSEHQTHQHPGRSERYRRAQEFLQRMEIVAEGRKRLPKRGA